jgi:hypothetical protein
MLNVYEIEILRDGLGPLMIRQVSRMSHDSGHP